MPRIYITTPLTINSEIMIDGSAGNHISRVLRLKPGENVTLFNGEGGEYSATLTAIERKTAHAHIDNFDPREYESPLQITLIQGISRGERMDYTLQKSVELGVNRIIPLSTERCNVKFDEKRAAKRQQHWQGVVISACEQCGRNRIPEIMPVLSLHHWLTTLEDNSNELRLLLNPRATRTLRQLNPVTKELSLLIGPEGGLSEREIETAIQSGFQGIQLGPRILRTETAGVAALAALQSHWGDMG